MSSGWAHRDDVGSLALAGNITNRDAPLIAPLRAAGAVILGKTNLSEWANIRSDNSTSGWSAVGGLTKNPHALDRNSCGSSSGSGSATAAGLAAGSIGTETDGSITCPPALGVVGFKPPSALSRAALVPISHSQDTAAPMTRSVRDAAIAHGNGSTDLRCRDRRCRHMAAITAGPFRRCAKRHTHWRPTRAEC
jgi:amidase